MTIEQIEREAKERMTRIEDDFKKLGGRFNDHLKIYAENGKEMAGLKVEIANVHEKLDGFAKGFVTKQEFTPVKILVYSFVGLILASVIGSMVTMVLIKTDTPNIQSELAKALEQYEVQVID